MLLLFHVEVWPFDKLRDRKEDRALRQAQGPEGVGPGAQHTPPPPCTTHQHWEGPLS
ncbi:hypothetical protein PLANTIT3_50452 [Plantibacter sp. T3]|nr:hypothetical protein PLANTIT3_50452 [Plantibacter sp. T3]